MTIFTIRRSSLPLTFANVVVLSQHARLPNRRLILGSTHNGVSRQSPDGALRPLLRADHLAASSSSHILCQPKPPTAMSHRPSSISSSQHTSYATTARNLGATSKSAVLAPQNIFEQGKKCGGQQHQHAPTGAHGHREREEPPKNEHPAGKNLRHERRATRHKLGAPDSSYLGHSGHHHHPSSPGMLLYYLAAIFKGLHPRVDDDFVDKLNYHYTSAIIFAFAIIVSAKQYVGYPIQCWVPAQFTDAWEQYTENYCWVQNTYYLPLHDPIPSEFTARNARQIGYYQWVPFVLALEALMFYIPSIIWRGMLHWYSGINIQGLTQMACDCRMMEAESRVATVQTIAGHMEDAIEIQREVGEADGNLARCLTCGRRCTGYVTSLYILIKLLYGLNVIGQLFLLNSFLGTRNIMYGFNILSDLLAGREWEESGHFPRVTMCDFEVRVLGNVHHHTVQCVLMINMFNEKIFLFLWFWFFLVAVVTLCSSAHWLMISALPGQRERFVKKYLKATDLVTDRSSVNKFVLKFLGYDGVFCLRMVSAHAGDLMATELIVALWHSFHNRVRKSPVEMYEPSAQMGLSSPSKMQEMNFKNWLMGQAGKGQPSFEGSNPTRGGGRKRRKSVDGYFSFV